MLDARGGRDDRYGLYGIYKTSKKTEEMSREESCLLYTSDAADEL